ncbi:MAG: hypothetical protein EZS28_004926 [Streblomastix strix]|uniref:Uncharacterized protein n=1 Tax=Streblomastix strix TaxID=222440 RepID=A0A5J4WZC2_9EUKA|nr:MAG: hypothetical protein EZS28_004926 [Streblomastix strix]
MEGQTLRAADRLVVPSDIVELSPPPFVFTIYAIIQYRLANARTSSAKLRTTSSQTVVSDLESQQVRIQEGIITYYSLEDSDRWEFIRLGISFIRPKFCEFCYEKLEDENTKDRLKMIMDLYNNVEVVDKEKQKKILQQCVCTQCSVSRYCCRSHMEQAMLNHWKVCKAQRRINGVTDQDIYQLIHSNDDVDIGYTRISYLLRQHDKGTEKREQMMQELKQYLDQQATRKLEFGDEILDEKDERERRKLIKLNQKKNIDDQKQQQQEQEQQSGQVEGSEAMKKQSQKQLQELDELNQLQQDSIENESDLESQNKEIEENESIKVGQNTEKGENNDDNEIQPLIIQPSNTQQQNNDNNNLPQQFSSQVSLTEYLNQQKNHPQQQSLLEQRGLRDWRDLEKLSQSRQLLPKVIKQEYQISNIKEVDALEFFENEENQFQTLKQQQISEQKKKEEEKLVLDPSMGEEVNKSIEILHSVVEKYSTQKKEIQKFLRIRFGQQEKKKKKKRRSKTGKSGSAKTSERKNDKSQQQSKQQLYKIQLKKSNNDSDSNSDSDEIQQDNQNQYDNDTASFHSMGVDEDIGPPSTFPSQQILLLSDQNKVEKIKEMTAIGN